MNRIVVGLLACFAVLSTLGATQAATLYVANNGVDGGGCGAQTNPCRSIGRAIANATADDTIIVGPGLYGNLGYDFTEAGEEPGPAACGSLICVDKTLTIVSSHGAEKTRLNAGSTVEGVALTADGTTFGLMGKGFSLYGEFGNSIRLGLVSGVEVSGNVIIGGLYIDGIGNTATHNQLISTHSVGSVAISVAGTGHSVEDNVVTGIPGSSFTIGFDIFGTGHSIARNVVVGTEEGVVMNSGTTGVTIHGNALLSNRYGVGVRPGAVAAIDANNIFANGLVAGNCGIYNDSGGAIDATNNYWGAASGPGGDPADELCNQPGSSTLVAPFATLPFPIGMPAGGGGTGAPVCSAAQAVPSVLWPPNGTFTLVGIIGVGDPDNDPVSIAISGVTQDEPTSGLSAADTGPDAILRGSSVDLRAQRAAGGNGRVYRVAFSASDGNGGTCTGAVTVGVPKSQEPGRVIVDDGQAYTSTQP